MKKVFADTFYWIALFNPKDQRNSEASQLRDAMRKSIIFTTEEVLTEFLTYFSGCGIQARKEIVEVICMMRRNPNIVIKTQSHRSFESGLSLYGDRLDKGYSLQDCISFNTMRTENIEDVLTHDLHFQQEGFHLLFK